MDSGNNEPLVVLAQKLPEDDRLGNCDVIGLPPGDADCLNEPEVLIGEDAPLAYCAAHAADLALQLLALPTVQAALAQKRQIVLLLDSAQAEQEGEALDAWLQQVVPVSKESAWLIGRLRQDLERQLNMIHPPPPGTK